MHLQNKDTFTKTGIIIFLAVAVFAIYWQIGSHQFILYDDEEYVLLNSRLQLGFTAENIRWFLTTSHSSNWHPVTWFSHILDVKLFGMNPAGHHLVTVAIHAINSILLFLLMRRMTGSLWRSAAVAALFAVHPLNVESVAWVSERKNVLSTTFFILTLRLYVEYAEKKSRYIYILAVSVFTLGLMSKQMLVSVPFILLLLDFWPLRRFSLDTCGEPLKQFRPIETRSLLLEKAPFLLLSVIASVIAVISQQRTIAPLSNTTVAERFANASISCVQYLRKIFWPNDLALFYPFPESMPVWEIVVSTSTLSAITVAAVRLRSRYPVLFVGWFWFLITLMPVIGIVKIGLQSMADRYAYIPTIGIFTIAVWLLAELAGNIPRRRFILSGITGICIIALSVTAWRQTSCWKDTMTVFSHALKVTERNFIALCTIGRALEKEGKLDEALEKFDEAIEIAPWYEYAKTHQGIILMSRGKLDAAVFKYNEAILQNPTTVPGHINLGIIMGMQGNLDEAAKNFRIAIDFDPRSAAANYNLALTLFQMGKNDEAVGHYLISLATNPTDHECHYNLGIVLERQDRYEAAIQHFRESLRLKPDYADAKTNLELALQKQRGGQRR